MDTRFLYSVNPKKPIRTIKGLPVLRTPKSLQLSKEEVKECLKYGSVYRRFANEARNERVTINSVDRLHNAKFMTEEEYEAFLKANIDGKTGTVINTDAEETVKPVEEEPVVETTTEETTEEVVENEEEAVVEPVVETEAVAEEVTESDEEETDAEETTEEVVENEEEAVVEPVVETEAVAENHSDKYKNNKNYGGKNHRR